MTNEEAIKILQDITWNSNGRYEITEMLDTRNLSIQTLEENTKLKAEIDRLNGKSEMYRDMADSFCNSNIKLKTEIEQLKSELEQSVKLPYLAGTPLYFAFSKQGIVKDKIRRWQINEHGILFCSKGSAYPVEFIGKYAFLTREEAEQSLKEMGK